MAAGVLVGAIVANRMQREPDIIDLTTGAASRVVRTPLVRAFAKTSEGPIEVVDAQPLREPSALRLYVEIPPAMSLHVVTLDANGVATNVESTLERPAQSAEGQRGFVAARIPASHNLRLFAVFAKTPLERTALRRAAERAFVEAGRRLEATRALHLASEHTHTSLVLIRPAPTPGPR